MSTAGKPAGDRPIAQWSISLDVECHNCHEDFDIVNSECEFWRSGIEPIETRTKRTLGYNAMCPHCDEEFECDFQY